MQHILEIPIFAESHTVKIKDSSVLQCSSVVITSRHYKIDGSSSLTAEVVVVVNF